MHRRPRHPASSFVVGAIVLGCGGGGTDDALFAGGDTVRPGSGGSGGASVPTLGGSPALGGAGSGGTTAGTGGAPAGGSPPGGGSPGDGGSPGGSGTVRGGGAPTAPAIALDHVIDHLDDCNNAINQIAGRQGYWYAYDSNCKAGITVRGTQWPPAEPCSSPPEFEPTARGAGCAARTYGSGFLDTDPDWGYAGVGFRLVPEGTGWNACAYSGVRFTLAGSGVRLTVGTTATAVDDADFGVDVATPGTHSILWSQLAQPADWGQPQIFDCAQLTKIQFQALTPSSFDFTVDDVDFFSGTVSSATGCDGIPTAPSGYCVNGNRIYDATGTEVIRRGVSRPSLEWSSSGEDMGPEDFDLMASWGATVVRIPLNQCFWNINQDFYRDTVASRINQAHSAGLDVILALQLSGSCTDLAPMADTQSIAFWQNVAGQFQSDGRVWFDLFSMPQVDCAIWRDGGSGYVGMQALYDAVRAAGANNLVLVSGIDWGYDLGCVAASPLTGFNIVYSTHLYPFAAQQLADWYGRWGFAADTYPVFIGEFGLLGSADASYRCDDAFAQNVVDEAAARGLGWTAWAWTVGDACNTPSLISDWNGTPSSWGSVVRGAL